MDDIYYQKYLKYKTKYLELQKISGGGGSSDTTSYNQYVKKMNSYDKFNNNKLKETIINFVNTLNDKDKKKLRIPLIPENHEDLKYIESELKDFQLFRFKIYNLLKNSIVVNFNNFKNINELIENKIYNLFFLTSNLNTYDFEKLLAFEEDIFIKLTKLNLNSNQLKELLDLNLDKITLNKFLKLNLEPDISKCNNSNCDISPNIINMLRPYKETPKQNMINILNNSFTTIRDKVNENNIRVLIKFKS